MKRTIYPHDLLFDYLVAALWSSTDESGEPMDDRFVVSDFATESIERAIQDIADFLDDCSKEGIDLSSLRACDIAHDFWLTRNGHGAGFWDRGLGELGEQLTKVAKNFGEAYVCEGDDGKPYLA